MWGKKNKRLNLFCWNYKIVGDQLKLLSNLNCWFFSTSNDYVKEEIIFFGYEFFNSSKECKNRAEFVGTTKLKYT